MKQSWYSRLKERSRAWLLPVHIILAVWFFLFVGNLEAGFPAARVLMPAYMIIMLGPVAFLVINIPLSIYTAVKLRKGQTDGENRTILIVFAALNAFIGLVVWGFLIAFILLAKDIEIPKVSEQIPAGYIEKAEHFDPDGFQDFTNYCKYVYPVGFVPADDPRFFSHRPGARPYSAFQRFRLKSQILRKSFAERGQVKFYKFRKIHGQQSAVQIK